MPVFTADDGVQIHYDVRGDKGPGIILSHGWCGNRNHWAPQLAHFSKNYRVLSIDRRGYGASTPPADYKYSLEREAKDAAQLAESLGITDALVVGHLGDCRAVLGGADGSALELTRDHTPQSERRRIEAAGGWLVAEQEMHVIALSRRALLCRRRRELPAPPRRARADAHRRRGARLRRPGRGALAGRPGLQGASAHGGRALGLAR